MAHQRHTRIYKSLKTSSTKNIFQTKDPLKRKQLQDRVKNYKKNLLKLTRKTENNHCNNFFQEKKLNLFKTWEDIHEIINITKKVSVKSNAPY